VTRADLAKRVALMMRGGIVVDWPGIKTGVAEHHMDGSVSFEAYQESDPRTGVTVTVTPGYKGESR
jgi:hypothetical protein